MMITIVVVIVAIVTGMVLLLVVAIRNPRDHALVMEVALLLLPLQLHLRAGVDGTVPLYYYLPQPPSVTFNP